MDRLGGIGHHSPMTKYRHMTPYQSLPTIRIQSNKNRCSHALNSKLQLKKKNYTVNPIK